MVQIQNERLSVQISPVGRVFGNEYAWKGEHYPMKCHGFLPRAVLVNEWSITLF